jgi:phenylpropionate dioxygenase-like ring-hydroxylating dioxygenase large terminal subunit
MIINNWYVACESTDLTDQPIPVRMLGCDFVLFRTDRGEAACLSAVCCHRGGDLSRGKRRGSCVQCPYHGWEFDAAGRCTCMPPLGEAAQPPKRARVDAYPVEERFGYVWVFLGDMAEGERPELPDFLPAYADTETWRIVRLQQHWNANWARVHENLLDTSHLYLVHSFGRHLPSKMTTWPTEKNAWGGRVAQRFASRPTQESTTPVNQVQAQQTRPESVVVLEFSIIGLMHKNTQQMASGYDQIIWNCLTPVDAYHTRNFGLHFRNFQKDAGHDESMLKTIRFGLAEDAVVVENLKPRLSPASPAGEMWMATDAMERVYRDQAAAFGRRLGEIDVRRYEDLSRDRVLVIPSPARRQEPGAWVHEPVPTRAGSGGDDDAVIAGMGV